MTAINQGQDESHEHDRAPAASPTPRLGPGPGLRPPLRLVATDLDGTLLGREQEVSARTVAALHACAAAGMEVVFVTARPPRLVTDLAAVVGVTATAICSNGALVLDCASGAVTVVRQFAIEDARRLVAQLRPAVPDAGFALETGREVWHEQAFRRGVVSGNGGRLTEPLDGAWARIDRIVKEIGRAHV